MTYKINDWHAFKYGQGTDFFSDSLNTIHTLFNQSWYLHILPLAALPFPAVILLEDMSDIVSASLCIEVNLDLLLLLVFIFVV